MEEAVRKRLNRLVKESGMSETAFAESVNVVQVTLNRQLSGKRSVSADTILSVLQNQKDLSAEWLLRGEGAMYKTTELPPVDVSSEESIEHSAEIARLVREKNELVDIIEAQAKEIARLQAQLDWASSIIKDSLREEPAQKVG
jgi:transcriptional regulator with XRE-family HTH domain